MDDANTKLKRRSCVQFSVRALLLAVIMIAVFLGVQVNRCATQARAVAEVKAYGGFVHYDYEYKNGAYKSGCEPWAPSWLRAAIGDDFFRTAVEVNLIFDGAGAAQVQTDRTDDAVMPVLRDLPGLKTLVIHEGQATDRSMEVVGHLSSLENLYMAEGPGLTDAGLANLAGLTRAMARSSDGIVRSNQSASVVAYHSQWTMPFALLTAMSGTTIRCGFTVRSAM